MPVSPVKMADAIRVLSMDAVHKAKSGHQGMPMGMADVATVLWGKFLKFDAAKPDWADRDRFVLSAGHGSMLLYSLLHLTGFKAVTMKEIENFRQWGSLTPGPPRSAPHAGRRDHHRPAGPGPGHRRRHGHGRGATWPPASARTSSTTAPG
jgi:transketolase